jgi:LPXTG-motif cell wall-anchored protein
MKNSTIYVVGGLILLSGVAFLYFKNKSKKDELETENANKLTENILDDGKKEVERLDNLALEIKKADELKKAQNIVDEILKIQLKINFWKKSILNVNNSLVEATAKRDIARHNEQIMKYAKQLKLLGYAIKDNKAIKIK